MVPTPAPQPDAPGPDRRSTSSARAGEGTNPRAIPDPTVVPTLTVEGAARILGISRGLAYESVRSGGIPSLRIGRRLVVPTASLLAMLGQPARYSVG